MNGRKRTDVSQRKVEMVDDSTPDVDADGVEDEFRQLDVCHVQRLEASVKRQKFCLSLHRMKNTYSAIADERGSLSCSSGCTGVTMGRYGDVGDSALEGSSLSGLVSDVASSVPFNTSSCAANQVCMEDKCETRASARNAEDVQHCDTSLRGRRRCESKE